MATQQAWEDFEHLVALANDTKGHISQLCATLTGNLTHMNEVLGNTPRRVAAKEIADIHPVYSVAWFQAALADFNTLKSWMDANGYNT